MLRVPELGPFLDRFAEAVLVDLADSPDDELVPIGRVLVDAFDAEERGYLFPDDLTEMELTAGELRERMRELRAELAFESA